MARRSAPIATDPAPRQLIAPKGDPTSKRSPSGSDMAGMAAGLVCSAYVNALPSCEFDAAALGVLVLRGSNNAPKNRRRKSGQGLETVVNRSALALLSIASGLAVATNSYADGRCTCTAGVNVGYRSDCVPSVSACQFACYPDSFIYMPMRGCADAPAAISSPGQENPTLKKAAEHNRKAAEHHSHAARHHGMAATHYDAGDHEKAAHHSLTARKHVIRAREHAEEAVKAHGDIDLTTDHPKDGTQPLIKQQNH
jgi:hypothetical protein